MKKELVDQTKKLVSMKNDVALCIDEVKQKIYLFTNYYNEEKLRSYSLKDLLQVEIIEDNVTITKTSRTSQVGGAIVGGMLAGGVGAVIGGLSGKDLWGIKG